MSHFFDTKDRLLAPARLAYFAAQAEQAMKNAIIEAVQRDTDKDGNRKNGQLELRQYEKSMRDEAFEAAGLLPGLPIDQKKEFEKRLLVLVELSDSEMDQMLSKLGSGSEQPADPRRAEGEFEARFEKFQRDLEKIKTEITSSPDYQNTRTDIRKELNARKDEMERIRNEITLDSFRATTRGNREKLNNYLAKYCGTRVDLGQESQPATPQQIEIFNLGREHLIAALPRIGREFTQRYPSLTDGVSYAVRPGQTEIRRAEDIDAAIRAIGQKDGEAFRSDVTSRGGTLIDAADVARQTELATHIERETKYIDELIGEVGRKNGNIRGEKPSDNDPKFQTITQLLPIFPRYGIPFDTGNLKPEDTQGLYAIAVRTLIVGLAKYRTALQQAGSDPRMSVADAKKIARDAIALDVVKLSEALSSTIQKTGATTTPPEPPAKIDPPAAPIPTDATNVLRPKVERTVSRPTGRYQMPQIDVSNVRVNITDYVNHSWKKTGETARDFVTLDRPIGTTKVGDQNIQINTHPDNYAIDEEKLKQLDTPKAVALWQQLESEINRYETSVIPADKKAIAAIEASPTVLVGPNNEHKDVAINQLANELSLHLETRERYRAMSDLILKKFATPVMERTTEWVDDPNWRPPAAPAPAPQPTASSAPAKAADVNPNERGDFESRIFTQEGVSQPSLGKLLLANLNIETTGATNNEGAKRMTDMVRGRLMHTDASAIASTLTTALGGTQKLNDVKLTVSTLDDGQKGNLLVRNEAGGVTGMFAKGTTDIQLVLKNGALDVLPPDQNGDVLVHVRGETAGQPVEGYVNVMYIRQMDATPDVKPADVSPKPNEGQAPDAKPAETNPTEAKPAPVAAPLDLTQLNLKPTAADFGKGVAAIREQTGVIIADTPETIDQDAIDRLTSIAAALAPDAPIFQSRSGLQLSISDGDVGIRNDADDGRIYLNLSSSHFSAEDIASAVSELQSVETDRKAADANFQKIATNSGIKGLKIQTDPLQIPKAGDTFPTYKNIQAQSVKFGSLLIPFSSDERKVLEGMTFLIDVQTGRGGNIVSSADGVIRIDITKTPEEIRGDMLIAARKIIASRAKNQPKAKSAGVPPNAPLPPAAQPAPAPDAARTAEQARLDSLTIAPMKLNHNDAIERGNPKKFPLTLSDATLGTTFSGKWSDVKIDGASVDDKKRRNGGYGVNEINNDLSLSLHSTSITTGTHQIELKLKTPTGAERWVSFRLAIE